MKSYGSTITLSKTSRGVWGIDTVKGCKYGMAANDNGCYGACYACNVSKRYGVDFSNSVLRRFRSKEHEKNILSHIESIDMDFVRIGIMGDPSECWGHTIEICDKIKHAGKKIVIITKHWETIPGYLLDKISSLGLIVNTSVSALDDDYLIDHRLSQYEKLKNVCNSVLRVVSCDFNINNMSGLICDSIQIDLLNHANIIDTALRIGKNHYLHTEGIVNIETVNFMSKNTTVSLGNKKNHLGYCESCYDKCGTGIKYEN